MSTLIINEMTTDERKIDVVPEINKDIFNLLEAKYKHTKINADTTGALMKLLNDPLMGKIWKRISSHKDPVNMADIFLTASLHIYFISANSMREIIEKKKQPSKAKASIIRNLNSLERSLTDYEDYIELCGENPLLLQIISAKAHLIHSVKMFTPESKYNKPVFNDTRLPKKSATQSARVSRFNADLGAFLSKIFGSEQHTIVSAVSGVLFGYNHGLENSPESVRKSRNTLKKKK